MPHFKVGRNDMKLNPLIKTRRLDNRNRLVIPAPLSVCLAPGAGLRMCPGRVVAVIYPEKMLKRGLFRNLEVIVSDLRDELQRAGEL